MVRISVGIVFLVACGDNSVRVPPAPTPQPFCALDLGFPSVPWPRLWGPGPQPFALVDADRDGIDDLRAPDMGFFGRGDGRFVDGFGGQVIGGRVVGFAVGDLDGDGHDDLAKIAQDSSSGSEESYFAVELYDPTITLGDGGQVGSHAVSVTIADLNNDGVNDLVVANAGDGTVSVLLNSKPVFSRVDLAVGAATWVEAGDLDRDGNADLVVAGGAMGTIAVLRGNGDGTFQPPLVATTSVAAERLALVDVNRDGRLDILATGSPIDPTATARTNVLLGNGDGTFQPARDIDPAFLTVADVNHDGRVDLIDGAAIALGRGDGSFRAPQRIGFDVAPTQLIARDVNRDGNVDLIASGVDDRHFAVVLGNSDGTFAFPLRFPPNVPANSIALADLDGDGILDVVTANAPASSVSVQFGSGRGQFEPAIHLATTSPASAIQLADLDGDGVLDLIYANDDNTIGAMLGRGARRFADPITAAPGSPPIAIADLDGDGIPDLLTATGAARGFGDGTFREPIPAQFRAGTTSIAVGDVDNDGRLDIVTSDATGFESRLARGAGFVTPPRNQIPDSMGATTIALGDVDGDGRLDAVIGESCGFMVMLGRGDGTFAEPNSPIACAPNLPSQIAVRDLDGDGRADIVFANQDSNTVSVCINACNNNYGNDGNFVWPLDFPGGTMASPIVAIGDVDNDGLPDIVAGAQVDVLLARCGR